MADDVHVHQQPPAAGGDGGAGWIIALVVVVLLVVVIWFGFMRGDRSGVPEQVDIDINVPEAPAPSTPPSTPPDGGS